MAQEDMFQADKTLDRHNKDVSASFRVTYDGKALENSEMDARNLAPALLAIGDLLENSTRVLYGKEIKASVNVKGGFKTGSFGIEFSLATSVLVALRDLFSSDAASATANALQIPGAVGLLAWHGKKSLLSVLKWLKNRPIRKVELLDKTAMVHVDNESIEIELEVLKLLRDLSVRDSVERMLHPLNADGVDVFATGTDADIVETISYEEVAWFKSPAAEDTLLIDEVRKMAFSIVSLAFKEDNKWRLHDGASTIRTSISDPDFLYKVDNNLVSFSKGDVLVCEVSVRQWQTDSGAKTEYDVIKVVDHRMAYRQIALPGI